MAPADSGSGSPRPDAKSNRVRSGAVGGTPSMIHPTVMRVLGSSFRAVSSALTIRRAGSFLRWTRSDTSRRPVRPDVDSQRWLALLIPYLNIAAVAQPGRKGPYARQD